jgi:hypothetical protein
MSKSFPNLESEKWKGRLLLRWILGKIVQMLEINLNGSSCPVSVFVISYALYWLGLLNVISISGVA